MTLRFRAGLLALLSTAGLAGCSAGSTATQVGRPDDRSVIIGTTGAPSSLDFTSTGGAAIPQALVGNVYETLVRIDDHGTVVPGLATRWDVSPDGKTYTFSLVDDKKFSNGDAFTASTAAYSITAVKEKWTNGLKAQMDVVDKTEAVNEHTLRVTLKRPSQQWLWSMATLTGAMMTPNASPADLVGTGPYVVDKFVPGSSISFKGSGKSAMIKYFSDSVGSVNALRAGDIDAVYALGSPELLDTLPQKFHVATGTTNGEVLLSMNNQRAPFNDVRVRQAVAYAIDRNAVNQVVWNGLATDTGGAPVPPTDPWFPHRDYYPYNPAKARELLTAAGNPHVTISVPTLPYAQSASELIYSQLKAVGFDVKLESKEFPAVWLGDVMGRADYQMSLIAHVEARDIPTLFANPKGYLRYDNKTVQNEVSREDMPAAVDTIMADMPALTVANLPNIVLTAPGVRGVPVTSPTGELRLAGIEK